MTKIITVVLLASDKAEELENESQGPEENALVEAIATALQDAGLGEALSVVVEDD